jgi:hypothetical protein
MRSWPPRPALEACSISDTVVSSRALMAASCSGPSSPAGAAQGEGRRRHRPQADPGCGQLLWEAPPHCSDSPHAHVPRPLRLRAARDSGKAGLPRTLRRLLRICGGRRQLQHPVRGAQQQPAASPRGAGRQVVGVRCQQPGAPLAQAQLADRAVGLPQQQRGPAAGHSRLLSPLLKPAGS